jgi:hypothetical protein
MNIERSFRIIPHWEIIFRRYFGMLREIPEGDSRKY